MAAIIPGDGICTEALGRLAGDAVGESRVVCAEAGGVKGAQEQLMAEKIKYEGVTGTIQFDPFGDIRNGALTLFTYKAGKRSRIDVIR